VRYVSFSEGNSTSSLSTFVASRSGQGSNRILQIFTGVLPMRVPRREPLLKNRHGIFKQWNGFAKSSLTGVVMLQRLWRVKAASGESAPNSSSLIVRARR